MNDGPVPGGREWLETRVGSPVRRLLWSRGHLSSVSLVELSDGRRVVLKVRPWADRLLDCGRAQSAAAAAGIRCPRVIAGPGLWPPPDDMAVDLNRHGVAPWLDGVARDARDLIVAASLERVVGHGDWESQNLRWISSAPHCIHDWDSLVFEPEAALAGAAAAVYVARGGPGQASSFEQAAAFIDAYDDRLPRGLTAVERGVAWSAGV